MLISSLIFIVSTIVATPPKIEGAPVVERQAIRVAKGDAVVADFWFCRTTKLEEGNAVGIVKLHKPWRDYRDREVPAGAYLLRFRIQPLLKDHAGTSRYREFFVLEPSAGHPFVMAIVPAEEGDVTANVAGRPIGIVLEGHGNLGL